MARFACTGTGINTSGYGLLGVIGASTVRPKVYDIIIGSRASPLDNTCTYDVSRAAGAGANGAAATPKALDELSAALTSTGYQNSTSGAVKANILLSVSLNQRATFRWVAAPGSELVCSIAGTAPSIYIFANTPTTAAFICETTMLFEE